ncbi:glycosyltransferase family 4 protein [Chryseobacterium antibioticum]|uniref:Glycosyltransferase family 4 protein n=1 Tax=Chryseobacterium pyrolae TaxID=2987481 RepID=A0ABT2ILQ5_9FLAO|nr:glycosyltransferase family 4 protein [Chryseobacterium pyrolae]MCT2409546.1 glycosyltransferase family 4 protein [Chryseobacterium pyrolae]
MNNKINVLWITNILLPDICEKLGFPKPFVGGWMFALSKYLSSQEDVSLAIASVYNGTELQEIIVNNITYFLIPIKDISEYDQTANALWTNVNNSFKPDIVHIHGTEFPYGLSYIKASGADKCVISIQGLTSVYTRYFLGGLTKDEIDCSTSLYDKIRKNTLYDQQLQMAKRGEIEIEYIKTVKNIIGRTDWDKDHVWAINPNTKYHFCNETLRAGFYTKSWDYKQCEKYSIFLSQGMVPLKGIHQLIKALPLILRSYPDTKVYIAGKNIIHYNSFRDKLTRGPYARYISNLIKKYNIENNIVFLGSLNEKQMIERYLKSNVFVCPSAIENSPNSLGESQILGVPVVSAYCGGVPNMINDKKTGFLYRYEETESLARIICEVFDNTSNVEISRNEIEVGHQRHSVDHNGEVLKEIYYSIKNN